MPASPAKKLKVCQRNGNQIALNCIKCYPCLHLRLMLSEACDPFGLQTGSSREWGNGEFLSEAGDSFLSIAGGRVHCYEAQSIDVKVHVKCSIYVNITRQNSMAKSKCWANFNEPSSAFVFYSFVGFHDRLIHAAFPRSQLSCRGRAWLRNQMRCVTKESI